MLMFQTGDSILWAVVDEVDLKVQYIERATTYIDPEFGTDKQILKLEQTKEMNIRCKYEHVFIEFRQKEIAYALT